MLRSIGSEIFGVKLLQFLTDMWLNGSRDHALATAGLTV